MPINKSDYSSMIHDIEYKKAKYNYLKNPTPENRKKLLNNVWKADDKFINEMEHDHEEPMAPIAGKLIKTKNFWKKQVQYRPKHLRDSGKIQLINYEWKH